MLYDLIIIGAGPAGLTASIYASRSKIKHLVIGKTTGGYLSLTHLIENYPGFQSIKGNELAQKFIDQVKSYGIKIEEAEVTKIEKKNNSFWVVTNQGNIHQAKTLILALGTERRKLNIPGEEKFWGKGVTYCATCDAPLYKNKIVAVAGASNAGLMAASLLTGYATKIYLIEVMPKMGGEKVWQDRIINQPKIEIILGTQIKEIQGDGKVEKIILDKPYQKKTELKIDGLFIEIGSVPFTHLIESLGIKTDQRGFIEVDKNQATNLAGVFAAGDITNATNLKQIITAASQGAIAAISAYRYLTTS